jgi:hypothetical protein
MSLIILLKLELSEDPLGVGSSVEVGFLGFASFRYVAESVAVVALWQPIRKSGWVSLDGSLVRSPLKSRHDRHQVDL